MIEKLRDATVNLINKLFPPVIDFCQCGWSYYNGGLRIHHSCGKNPLGNIKHFDSLEELIEASEFEPKDEIDEWSAAACENQLRVTPENVTTVPQELLDKYSFFSRLPYKDRQSYIDKLQKSLDEVIAKAALLEIYPEKSSLLYDSSVFEYGFLKEKIEALKMVHENSL